MSERPELIELFLTDLEKFQKKFNLILERTPNIAISKDSGFFIYFFLGALLALPEMSLVKKIGIKKILLKKENKETIKVCFVTEDKLIFRIITTCDADAEHSVDESKGKKFLVSKKDGKHKLYIGELKEEAHTEDQLLQQGFKELAKSSIDIFENELKQLSDDKGDNVKSAAEKIFKNLIKIYQNHEQAFFSGKQSEVVHQAFTYGFFMLNCKNRYLIDCLLEFATGRGFADLVLISRKDHEDFNATPMVVEFKANSTTASEAIEQIKNRGYAFTSLGIRTKAKQFIVVGVNYNKSEEEQLAVESHETIQPKGFISMLLDKLPSIDSVIDLNNEIENESKFLYYSVPRGKNGYFSRLILGQLLYKCINGISLSIHSNHDDRNEQFIKFIIKESDKEFVLNITEYKDSNYSPRLDSDDYSGDSDVSTASESTDDETINIRIHSTDPSYSDSDCSISTASESAENITENTNNKIINIRIHSAKNDFDSYCKINYNYDEGYILNEKIIYSTQDCSIDEIIEEMKAGKSDTLGEALFPIKKFITCESDLQAVMQGLFMHAKIKNNVDIIAHTEFSSCGSGRADLVLHFLKEGKETSDPIIMELKYCNETKNPEIEMKGAGFVA